MGVAIVGTRISCPECASDRVRRATRHGLAEWLLKRVRVVPYRCLQCDTRFLYGRILPWRSGRSTA